MDLIKDVSNVNLGTMLSPSFNLAGLTVGSFNKVLGKWTPMFPSQINPWNSNGLFSPGFPLLKVVQNLQLNSMNVLENLISTVGSQLNVQSGFLNNIPVTNLIDEKGHLNGLSIDVSVNGFTNNPLYIAKDIQKICKKAEAISMVFGVNGNSHFHINYGNGNNSKDLPYFTSVDLATGEIFQNKIYACRGYV